MNILIVGGGGREHALAWKVAGSSQVQRVFVAPGNPGTASEPKCENLAIGVSDIEALLACCGEHSIDLVVIGPEAPLVAGLADRLRANGIAVVGCNADGAQLEGSKAYAKALMLEANIPTARAANVSSADEVDAFVAEFDGGALVVKADGLAAGKGVIVCDSAIDAAAAAKTMLRNRTFGDASDLIVLEERLYGIETSYIVLASGTDFVAMPTSQDHKRLLNGDEGPNTGGMGAYSPAPFVTEAVADQIEREVIRPALETLKARGISFRGFLFAGIMLTDHGPKVLEFNVRLGDPETQVIMTALGDDLVPALLAAALGEPLPTLRAANAAAVVVMAAEGYPTSPKKGAIIRGLAAATSEGPVKVFHAGTRTEDGEVVVNGGRVLGVTGTGTSPTHALAAAYASVRHITWNGAQYRDDIGHHVTDD